jgi:tetratricopeptide (TPR) repeat protein
VADLVTGSLHDDSPYFIGRFRTPFEHLSMLMSHSRIRVNPQLARLRHAQHYIAVARLADDLYIAGDHLISRGVALYERDRFNLDIARQWLQNHAGSSDIDALLVADADASVYISNLRYLTHRERIIQLDMALGAAKRLNHRKAQGNISGNLGVVLAATGSTRLAISMFEQQFVFAREIGDRRGEENALGNLGLAYANLGDVRLAIQYYQEALTIAREIGDRRGEGNALGNLGLAYADLDDMHRAIEFYEQRLIIARAIRDRSGVAQTLGNLGSAYAAIGNVPAAIDAHQESLAIMREISDRRGEANALGNLGLAYVAVGDISVAITIYQESLAIMREIGDRRAEGGVLGNLGLAYEALTEWHRAIDHYQQHLVVAREIGDRRGEAYTSWNLGRAYVRVNRVDKAFPLLEQYIAYAREIGHPNAESEAALVAYLQQYGAWPQSRLDIESILQELEPLLQAIAASINGDAELRCEISEALNELEDQGWMLREPVEQIWAGERNHMVLTAHLDEQDGLIIAQVLKLITDATSK